jgi:multidrug efflux pump subunit AcrA (membrane-fusion protein)
MFQPKKYLIVLILFAVLLACKNQEPPAPPETVIRPVKVLRIGMIASRSNEKTFSGVAEAIESPTLSFRVPGVLQTLVGAVGNFRNEGEEIASLDPRDFILAVKDFENQLNSAQAKLDEILTGAREEDILKLEAEIRSLESAKTTALLEYKRVQQLYANDVAAKSRLDKARSDLDLAIANLETKHQELAIAMKGGREEEVRAQEATIKSIESNLEKTKASLVDTQLRMPFDGMISVKHVSNFEQINAGQEIFDVVQIDSVEVQISIPESMIAFVKKGQQVDGQFLTIPNKKFKGKITKVGVAADKTTLTYPVWSEFDNPNKEILPGMSANIFMIFRSRGTQYPVLPIHSVLEDKVSKNKYVWKFDPSSSTAKKITVAIGIIVQNNIEIKKGLKKGDLIIIAGLDQLEEGMKVRLRKKKGN